MPVKNCIYDALQYAKQVKAIADRHKRDGDSKGHTSDEFLSGFYKGDRIKPVVTLVVYFGNKEWDGPMSLKDMMEEQDQEMMEFVQDYKIHLIQPASISNMDFSKFHSDLGTVLKFIKLSGNYEEMLAWKHTGDMGRLSKDAALVVEACTKTVIDVPEGSEVVSVCEAIDMMNQKAAEAAVKEAEAAAKAAAKAAVKVAVKEQNIKTLLVSVKALTESMGLSPDEAMSALKVSVEDRSTLMTLL